MNILFVYLYRGGNIRRYIYFTLLGFLLVLSACSNTEKDTVVPTNNEKYEGFIIQKQNRNNGLQILVMSGIKKEDIANKTLDELIKQAQDDHSAVYFFVNENEYKNLKVGQKVVVWYKKGQPQMESNRPQTDMKKIEVIEE
jgi:hypothetical protein